MDKSRFLQAATARDIPPEAAASLYDDLYAAPPPLARPTVPFDRQPRLTRTVQVLIWTGTVLLVGAHAWWSSRGYEALGMGVVLALTLTWQGAFLAAAEWARRRGELVLESGFAAIVAFYTPLTAYAAERLLGFHFASGDFDDFYPYVSGGWVWMEIAAIGASALLLFRYRRPFLALPLTLFTGFLVIDGATRALGGWDRGQRVEQVVLAAGVVMLAAAIGLDYRGWRRFAFWPHLTAIWLVAWGLDWVCDGRHTVTLFLAACIALVLGIWLARATLLAAGGLFGWAALGFSAHGAAFPFLLTLGGLCFVGLAIWLSRSDSPVRRFIAARELPAPQRDLAY